MKYDFLVETYATERLKTVSSRTKTFHCVLEATIPEGVVEQIVHQCVSEEFTKQYVGSGVARDWQ